jgi:heme exporter protein A
MLSVQDLSCIRGQKQLFQSLSFDLNAGQWIYLKGENGTGKTSLLRILATLTQPQDGQILWNGASIQEELAIYREQLFYVSHYQALKDELTPLENLAFLLGLFGLKISEHNVMQTIWQLGLYGCEHLPVRYLSAGQKRRVVLAGLLLRKSTLWLLDEPFNALDVSAVQYLTDLIRGHLVGGGMAILTSHQEIHLPNAQVVQL